MEKHPLELSSSPSDPTHTHHSPPPPITPHLLLTTALPPSHQLYSYSNFPINLPKSHFSQLSNVQNLFQVDSEEDEEFPQKNQVKHLNHNQLESVKRRGTFTLQSTTSKPTTYKLSPLLQKGSEIAYEEFLDSIAFLGRILFIYVPRILTFLWKSLKELGLAGFHFINILIGLKTTKVTDLEKKIHFERCKFLVAELRVGGGKTTLHPLARYIQHQIAKSKKERILLLNNQKPPPIPYKFFTPKGLEVDLSLFDRSLFTRITPILGKILEKTNKTDSWFLQQRERIVCSLGTDKSFEFEANQQIHQEYMTRLVNEIFKHGQELDNLDHLLVEQVGVWSCLRCCLDALHNSHLPAHIQQELKKIKNSSPLLSRDEVWLREQEKRVVMEFYERNKFTAHEIALEELRKKSLFQASYFVSRDLYFLRETAPILEKELSRQRQPCKVYEWKVAYKDEPLFTTTSSTIFHRLFSTLIYRYLATLLTLLYYSLQKIPLDSPYSYQVLYKKTHSSPTSKPHRTLHSELFRTWRLVSKERSKYLSSLHTKKINSRHGNFINFTILQRLENLGNLFKWYFYGVAMTIFWTVIYSFAILVINLSCLVVVVTCVLWPMVYCLGYHGFCVLVKDLDGDEYYGYFPVGKFLWVVGVSGVKIAGGGVVLLVGCPLGGVVVFLVSLTTYLIRLGYDSLIYNLLIKKHARVPMETTSLLEILPKQRKLYKITEKQALLILLTKLELEKLTHFQNSTLKKLNQPIFEYETFFEQFLSPFSCNLNSNLNGFYRDLVRETFLIKEKLDFLIDQEKSKLNSLILPRDFIKITNFDNFCCQGVAMVTRFYKDLIGEYKLDRGGFFGGKGLEFNDWEGLFLNLVGEVFGMRVLFGNSGGDCGGDEDFILVKMDQQIPSPWIPSSDLIHPLTKQFSLTRTEYELHPPYVTMETFSPFVHPDYHHRDLLLNPLPLLHPVVIATLILNREEDLVDLGDVAVRAVVAVMEEAGPARVLGRGEVIEVGFGSEGSGSESEGESGSGEGEEEIVMNNSYLGTSV